MSDGMEFPLPLSNNSTFFENIIVNAFYWIIVFYDLIMCPDIAKKRGVILNPSFLMYH